MTLPDDELPATGTPRSTTNSNDETPPDTSTEGAAADESDLLAGVGEPPAAALADGEEVPSTVWPPLAPFRSTPDRDFEPALDDEEEQAAAARPKRHRARRVVWELTQTLVLAALIFLLVRAVAQNFRVEGPSMEPGLHNGQYLLVNKAVYFKLNLGTLSKYIPFIDAEDGEETFLFHGPQRGDVVVFRYPKDPDRDFIKRIIGVPGDTVRIDDAGTVFVNGEPIEEGYISDTAPRALEEQIVPPESYFVLGDNRPNSSDSRNWGFVPEENIIGKAMLSYWPLSELGGVGNHSLDLGFVEVPLP